MNQANFTQDSSPASQATAAARAAMSQGIEAELIQLRKFNWSHRLFELGFFLLLWLTGISISLAGWKYLNLHGIALAIALTAGIGMSVLAINALVLLLHEGMHDILFPQAWLNHAAAFLLGSTVLMSFSAYQLLHHRHHKYLGDPRDPDDYHNYTQNKPLRWLFHFVRLTIGCPLYICAIPALALKYGNKRERIKIGTEYVLLLCLWLAALKFLPLGLLSISWLIPMLIVGIILPIRGITQHTITNAQDPYLASRTIMAHPVVAFFLVNENFHLEHHLFPEIPSYNLPELHRLIWPRLPYALTGTSYLGFIRAFLKASIKLDETPIGMISK